MILKNFIVFEGCEGSGKSTQARIFAEHLKHIGKTVWITKEPGGTGYGTAIRNLLLFERPEGGIDFRTEFLLFEADRAAHVPVIRRHHDAGEYVVCDRFSFSTFAYQGYGRGLFPEHEAVMRAADSFARHDIHPRIIFLLDQNVSVGLERKRTQQKLDAIEQEAYAFHERVRKGFLDMAKADGYRTWHHIKADRPADGIAKDIWAIAVRELGLTESEEGEP